MSPFGLNPKGDIWYNSRMREFRPFRPYSYRKKEIIVDGVYHITQRAPGSDRLFLEENDYLSFLSLLKSHVTKYVLEIFCFCLMGNHLHLLLRIKEPNLAEAMHSLYTKYAMAFNKKYKRKGHVFSGVYRASMVMDDAHLLAASLYIHLNPRKAKIISDCRQYRWSSVRLYLERILTKSFVQENYILNMLNRDERKARKSYSDLLDQGYKKSVYKDVIEERKAIYDFTKSVYAEALRFIEFNDLKADFVKQELAIDKLVEEYRDKKYINTPNDKAGMNYLVKQLKSRGYSTMEIAHLLSKNCRTIYRIK